MPSGGFSAALSVAFAPGFFVSDIEVEKHEHGGFRVYPMSAMRPTQTPMLML